MYTGSVRVCGTYQNIDNEKLRKCRPEKYGTTIAIAEMPLQNSGIGIANLG
jgi:hypothetical protein